MVVKPRTEGVSFLVASFQVLPENFFNNNSPHQRTKLFSFQSLVYGRKIKLLHVGSNMYLSYNDDKSSLIGSKIMTLIPEYKKESCLFCILPYYTNKNRGEDVMPLDQVKIESVSEKGKHLLCAFNSVTSKYELKMASTDSVFVISLHSFSHVHLPMKTLRGCDVIMLFNHKQESYLAGHSSTITDILPEEIKGDCVTEVGAKKIKSINGIQQAPSLSGDCFWQLEKVNDPLNGDEMKFSDSCRIRHVLTQQYVAVVMNKDQYHLTLKRIEAGGAIDPETTFSLVSNTGKNDVVTKCSYVKIKHIHSGKNLSVQAFCQDCKHVKTKWFELGLEDNENFSQQYFYIKEIKPHSILDCYYICGVTSVLKEYLQKFTTETKPFPYPPLLDEPIEALIHFSQWLRKECRQKIRINIFRKLQGIDLLMGLLQQSKSHKQDKKALCHKISVVLLEYVQSENRKSVLYLATEKFIQVIWENIWSGSEFQKIFATLIGNDSAIAKQKINENPDFILSLLKDSYNASFLHFLSDMCFTAGKPVMDAILRNIQAHEEDCFIFTEVRNGVVWFVHPKDIIGPLSKICSKETCNTNKKMFKYFIAQLKLFSTMCKELDTGSIYCITKLFTFEEALISIKDPELHPQVQSAYVNFMVSAYIEDHVQEYRLYLHNICHTFSWRKVCPQSLKIAKFADNVTNTDSIEREQIRTIQTCIRMYLMQNKTLYAEEEFKGHNELMCQMLALMELLIPYWKEDEISELIDILIVIVDGRNDQPKQNATTLQVFEYQKEKRFMSNESNRKIFDIKKRAVKIFHHVYNKLISTSLGNFVLDFKYMKCSDIDVSSNDNYTPINSSLLALLHEKSLLDKQIEKSAQARLRDICNDLSYSCFDTEGVKLVKILMDLLKYEDDDLRLSSMLLLFNMYQKENKVFDEASMSFIVTQKSEDINLFMSSHASFIDQSKLLMRLLQGTVTKKHEFYDSVADLLMKIRCMCMIHNDETRPHINNQKIAYSSGLLTVLLKFVQQFCSTDNTSTDHLYLLQLAAKTLQAIIRHNKLAQKRIYIAFVDLLKVKIALVAVARLMTETLSGNENLCCQLSEATITQMYTKAVTASSPEYFELFTTLETIMKPYKSSKIAPMLLKNYQELIAKLFYEHKNELVHQIMSSSAQKERLNLLKNSHDNAQELLKLLGLTDLLATTADGECTYAKDACQSVFSIEELVKIISNDRVQFYRKKPFAHILDCSYLSTEKIQLVSVIALLKNSFFWSHVEECAVLMELLCMKMFLIEDKELELVKINVRVLFSQHYSVMAWKERSKNFDVTLVSQYNRTFSLFSLLCYLLDGIVPVVKSFCAKMATNPSTIGSSQVYSCLNGLPNVVAVLKQFSDSFVALLRHHPSVFLTTPEMVQYWTEMMDMMAFVLPLDQNEILCEAKSTILSNENISIVSSDFCEELELNKEFQNYVNNFRITHERHGSNQRISQFHNGGTLTGPGLKKLMQIFSNFSDFSFLFPLIKVISRKLRQPLFPAERADIDFILLTSLKILSGVIYAKIESVDLTLMKSDLELFEKEYNNKVKPWQDLLVDMNAHEKVMAHLNHPKDEVVIQVLEFLSTLLYFCNKKAQEKICSSTYQTNFFIRFNKLLESVAYNIGQTHHKHARFKTSCSPAILASDGSLTALSEDQSKSPLSESKRLIHKLVVGNNGTKETAFSAETTQSICPYSSRFVDGVGQLETSEKEANERACVALDVISHLCDGQNRDMQDNFRKQDTDFFNVNIVCTVAVIFQTLAECFNENTFISTKKAIQSLIELCAGNFINQEVAFKCQVVNSINIVLSFSSGMHVSLEMAKLVNIKASAIELLEVLIEETDNKCKSLAQGVAQELSVNNLIATMKTIWMIHCKNYNCLMMQNHNVTDRFSLFRAFHILKKISDYTEIPIEKYASYDTMYRNDRVLHELWAYLNNYSRSIEVNYVTKNGEELLTKVFFPFAPTKQLSDSEKSFVSHNIKRTSPEDKVRDLLKWMEAIRKNFRHKAIINSNRCLYWTVAGSKIRHYILVFLTFLLNLFILLLLNIPKSNINSSVNSTATVLKVVWMPNVPIWFSNYLIYILGFFHVILSLWMVTEYYVCEAPNIYLRIPVLSNLINKKKGKLKKNSCKEKKLISFQYFQVNFIGFSSLYRVAFLLCSIAALGTSGYFYCGCILYVFLRNNMLQNVQTAVSRSAFQLISVALLGFSILFILAVVSFAFWHNYFDNEDRFCRTMLECYVSVIREGLFGTMLPIQYVNQSEPSFALYTSRAVFDLTCFIIITTLGLNIVVAIIIDRFSELRNEKDKINRDKGNYCFICGIDNDTFERKANGFNKHIKYDHNMWNYIYFLLHLDSIHKNDHNALEKYINDHITEQKIDFFPLRKAKVLGGKAFNTDIMDT